MLLAKVANESDIEKIVDFVNSAYRGDSSRQGWTTEADFLDGQRTEPSLLNDQIKGDYQKIFLFFDNREAVDIGSDIQGCVYIKKKQDACYLGMLTVNPKKQGLGYGQHILQYIEDWVKENWQSRHIEMTVISIRQELINWYIRKGYSITGEIEKFPYGDARFGIPKRDDLHFVVLRKSLV